MIGPYALPLRTIALTLLILAACLAIAPTSAVVMDETQVQALLEVAQDLPELGWNATGLRAACDDNSVIPQIRFCNATGFPQSIDLTDVSGPAPAAFSYLAALQYLRLSYNINGTLPSAWSSLSNLESLTVYGGFKFAGGLPESWSAMTNLRELGVFFPDPYNNPEVKQIASAPPSWLANLQRVEISHAYWPSSSLPASIGTSTSLTSLRLDSCDFKGDFPAGLLSNTVIQTLAVNALGTNFGAGIVFPSDLSGMTSLAIFGVSKAGFTGSIPASFPPTLTDFYMGYMPLIEGSVPQSLMDLPSLERITFLAMPKLKGAIAAPTNTAASSLRDVMYAETPGFSGTIPSSLFRINGNLVLTSLPGVVGPFPNITEDCRISFLDAFNLPGLKNEPLPIGVLENCPSLTSVTMFGNDFRAGQIANFTAGESLEYLMLLDSFGGTIPTIKFQLPMRYLSLRGCNFQGTVPTYLLNTINFQYIDFSDNKLDLCANSEEVMETGFVNSTDSGCVLSNQRPLECGCPNVWPERCFLDRPMAPVCTIVPNASPTSIISLISIALFASIVAIFVM